MYYLCNFCKWSREYKLIMNLKTNIYILDIFQFSTQTHSCHRQICWVTWNKIRKRTLFLNYLMQYYVMLLVIYVCVYPENRAERANLGTCWLVDRSEIRLNIFVSRNTNNEGGIISFSSIILLFPSCSWNKLCCWCVLCQIWSHHNK